MSNLRSFKQKLGLISRLWEEKAYDRALSEVEDLLEVWPGNGHLHILWASLVQLQENPKHSLDEVKQALHTAIDLDKTAPAGAIELGHFLDTVEDDPQAATRAYSEGIAAARQQLTEGLIGQAKGFLQLDRRDDALKCFLEVLRLADAEPAPKRNKPGAAPDIIFRSPAGDVLAVQLKGPFADQIEELFNELFARRSA